MTNMNSFLLTDHGRQRRAQRGLSEDDIKFVARYGVYVHAPGVVAYFLGKRHIPGDFRGDDRFGKLQGTTVVFSSDGRQVLTAYKNSKNGLQRFRRQKKYWFKMG